MRKRWRERLPKRLSVIFTIFIWLSIIGVTHAASNAKWIFYDGFETGSISSRWKTETCCTYSSQVIKVPVADGHFAHMFTLYPTDPRPPTTTTGKRAEFALKEAVAGRVGEERWYGVSIFIPSDWIDDYPINREIVAQWKYGDGSPAFDFQIQEGTFQIENRLSSTEPAQLLWSAPLAPMKGKWTDWIVHAKWSDGSNGLLEVWRDGQRVVKKQGPNIWNLGTEYIKFKIGIYKWSWDEEKYPGRETRVSQRVVYHDEVRIAGADATLQDMLLTQPPPASGVAEYHWLETEYPTSISAPMKIQTDSTASENQYITVPNGSGSGGFAHYTVTITIPGEYVLWGRVIAPTGDDDSFSIQIDSGGEHLWNVQRSSGWTWDLVNSWDPGNNGYLGDPVKFVLGAGTHTIKIKQREDGTRIDKLLLTNDLGFIPSGKGGQAENIPQKIKKPALPSNLRIVG